MSALRDYFNIMDYLLQSAQRETILEFRYIRDYCDYLLHFRGPKWLLPQNWSLTYSNQYDIGVWIDWIKICYLTNDILDNYETTKYLRNIDIDTKINSIKRENMNTIRVWEIIVPKYVTRDYTNIISILKKVNRSKFMLMFSA
jgi:hypothetical protein